MMLNNLKWLWIWLWILTIFIILSTQVHATVVQMLPNSTHGKAYKESGDVSCDFIGFGTSPASATVAYTDDDYANVNTSNNAYFSSSSAATKTDFVGDCIFNRYVFNVTKVNTSAITWIQYCIEGYYSNNINSGDMLDWFYWIIWNDNNQLSTSDAIYCYNFSTAIDSYIASDGTFAIGTDAGAYGDGFTTSVTTGYIDFVNVSVGFAGVTSDTCTYSGSGNWNIDLKDNCTISTSTTVSGNVNIYSTNDGWLNFQNNVFAHAFYLNATKPFFWYYNGYRWLY